AAGVDVGDRHLRALADLVAGGGVLAGHGSGDGDRQVRQGRSGKAAEREDGGGEQGFFHETSPSWLWFCALYGAEGADGAVWSRVRPAKVSEFFSFAIRDGPSRGAPGKPVAITGASASALLSCRSDASRECGGSDGVTPLLVRRRSRLASLLREDPDLAGAAGPVLACGLMRPSPSGWHCRRRRRC